jgi:hypothetical protein
VSVFTPAFVPLARTILIPMDLDADLFRRIVGDDAMPLPPDNPTDRRATGRVWVGRHAYLTRTAGVSTAPTIGVVVRDVSPRGAGLLTTTLLDAGDVFRLVLPLAELPPAGDASVILECRAVWRKAGEYGDGSSFIVGAEFLQRIA